MKQGYLLINLGTPENSRPDAVRKYLAEFLMDPYVIDIPWIFRALLVHGIILRTRPEKSALAYQKVWTEQGSPLLFNSQQLEKKVAELLGPDKAVVLGMRYGTPSIASALKELQSQGVTDLKVLPLYPQYSLAASESSIKKTEWESKKLGFPERLEFGGPFYDHPRFLNSFASLVNRELEKQSFDHVLFSYHGLPERQIRRVDKIGHCLKPGCCDVLNDKNKNCYRAQSFATTRALAAKLKLNPEQFSTSFQSRLGRTPWIKPYTDILLPELVARGIKKLLVVCPAFVADCLETLEEIRIRARADFLKAGGTELILVNSLNSDDEWARSVVEILKLKNLS